MTASSPAPPDLEAHFEPKHGGEFAGQRPAPLSSRFRSLVFLGLAASAISLSGAQMPDADYPAVRFTVFSPRPVAGVGFLPPGNAVPLPVEFYPTARSPEYEYRGPMPLRFVDLDTGDLVAEANVPGDMAKALLLFIPVNSATAPGGARYQLLVLDDGTVRHGPHGLAMVNLSGLRLTGMIDRRRIVLLDGLNPTIRVGETAAITLETLFQNRLYRSYSDTVSLAPGERALLLLLPPFYPGSLEVQGRLLVDEPAASHEPQPVHSRSSR